LELHADEAGLDYRCSECARGVFPSYYVKRQYDEWQVAIRPNETIGYVCGLLKKAGWLVTEIARAVHRITEGGREIHVCLAELCGENSYRSRDWLRYHPTLYVAVDESTMGSRFLPESWISRVSLADIVSGVVNLRAEIGELATTAIPQQVLDASIPIYTTGPQPIICASDRKHVRRHFQVEVRERTVHVSGEQVVSRLSGTRFRVFNALWKQFLDDMSGQLACADFRVLNIKRLSKVLCDSGAAVDEDTVRRTLNRLQEDIEVVVKKKLGLPIRREDIIETVRWAGQSDAEFGYRINPRRVIPVPQGSLAE
jgi:hypothetical protein